MTSISSVSSTTTTSTASSTSSTSSTSTSSIDWDALIEAAVQAKLDKADKIDLKITANEAKIEAYQSMQSLLGDLQDSAQALRAPSGTSAQDDDVFSHRAAYLTGYGSVDASSSVAVTVENGAQIGSHDLTIVQLAKAHKVASASVASATTELGYSGVISLGIADGGSVDITIDSGMTLAEIAETINNETDDTGVKASVLKVADGAYELILSTSKTGETIVAGAVSGDDVLNALGITDSSGAFANELQASAQAIITLDNVQITRSTNDIDDILDGVTFHLYQATPTDTSISVDVGTNLSDVENAVESLVEAYNAYREFAIQQQATDSSGSSDSSAVLFGDGTLRNVSTALAAVLGKSINGLSLADIGLSLDSNNELVLDVSTLENALLDDLDTVKSLLSYSMTASSSDLMLLARGSSAPSSFTLDVVIDSSGTITSASVDGDSSLFTISGQRIIGNAGTAYEGYSFVYTGSTSKSIAVSTSLGLAEQLYSICDSVGDTTDGTLEGLIENLQSRDSTLQSESDTIRAKAESYRVTLTNRYAKYQAAIAEAEAAKSYLETFLQLQSAQS